MDENIRTEKPVELFKEWVEEAIEGHMSPSEDSSFYLVQLLESFVRPRGLYVDVGCRPENPLGPMLFAAAHSHGMERFVLLRAVGDLALFLTGFFYESLERRLVTADYYARLGESAYGHAAQICRPKSSAALFEELAQEFVAFSLVLHRVSERCAISQRPELLSLYNQYLEEGDEHSEKLLQSYGITLHGISNEPQ